MQSEIIIYKVDYIAVQFVLAGGTTINFTLDNQQVRGDVQYKTGHYTQGFVAPNGATTSLGIAGGREFRFTLRLWENPAARYFFEQMKAFTQQRYSATFTLKYFDSIYTTFDSAYTDQLNSQGEAVLNNAIFIVPDHFADNNARGEGNLYPNEVEIVVREGAGLSLIQLPVAAVGVGTQTPCGGAINFTADGSKKVDGSAIDATSTGVLLEWKWGSFVTARIAPTDDPSAIANWIYVGGSWGSSTFEKRIVSHMASGGTGFSFNLNVFALAYYTGVSSLGVSVTVVEGADTSSENIANLVLDDYDEIFSLSQVVPSASHLLDLPLRWWQTCRALYVFADDSEEKDTPLSLTNNQHTFGSSGTKITRVRSSVDVREIICAREYVNAFTPTNCANVEFLALSEQFQPNSGGFYRDTYSNADDNDLPSLVLTAMTNLRELYAIACDLQQNTLFFGTHNSLEVLSIDHQPVMTAALLVEINLFSNLRKLRVGNHASSGALASPTFSGSNLEELAACFANISGTVTVSNATGLKVLRLDDNAGLSSVANTVLMRNIEVFSVIGTSIASLTLVSAACVEIGLPIFGSFFTFAGVPNLEKLTIENNTSIGVLNLTTNQSVSYVRADGCTSLTAVSFTSPGANVLDHFEVNNCNYDYTDANNHFTRVANATDVNNCTIILTSNGMTAAEVNNVLVDLDTISSSGYTGRSIDISSNTAPDTTSGGFNGSAAVTSLIAKGFSVTTD